MLRNIERTVKTTIRRRNAERSQYEYEQQERDLLDVGDYQLPNPTPEPALKPLGRVRQVPAELHLMQSSPGTVPLRCS